MMTQQYRQQRRCWWRVLSVFTNPGRWIHNAEHTLFSTTNSFLCLFSLLQPYLQLCRCHLSGLAQDHGSIFVSQFSLVLRFSRSVPLHLYPPPSNLPQLLTRWLFCHMLFSHCDTIINLMKHIGGSCFGVDFPGLQGGLLLSVAPFFYFKISLETLPDWFSHEGE